VLDINVEHLIIDNIRILIGKTLHLVREGVNAREGIRSILFDVFSLN